MKNACVSVKGMEGKGLRLGCVNVVGECQKMEDLCDEWNEWGFCCIGSE